MARWSSVDTQSVAGRSPSETSPLLSTNDGGSNACQNERRFQPQAGSERSSMNYKNIFSPSSTTADVPRGPCDDIEDEERCPSTGKSPDDAQLKKGSPWRMLSLLLLGVFISQLDQSLVLATYSQIASNFSSLSSASWLMSSFILAQCSVQPLYGKLSDIYSRKACLIAAYVLFTTGTLGCGVSQSMGQIIASRAVQGAGGAGMVSVVSIIVTDIMPKDEIATTRSYVNVLQTMGRSCGGVVGGLMMQAFGWRWAFLLQVPPMVLAIGIVSWGLHMPSKKAKDEEGTKLSSWEKLKRVDFIGAFFLALTILSICLILDLGGDKIAWSSKWMMGIIAVGIISAITFVFSARNAKSPIFPLELLAQRAVVTNYFSILLSLMSQMSLMTFVPIYFQSTAHASTAAAGAFLIPAFVGNTIGGLLTGFLIKKTGRYKVFTVLAPVISICCMVSLLIAWNGRTSKVLSLLIFPGGFAAGMVSSSAFVGLVDGILEEYVAVAASGSYLFFNLGAIAGVSVGSASFHAGLRTALERMLEGFPEKNHIISRATSDLKYLWTTDGSLRRILISAYVQGFHSVNYMGIICSSLALLAAVCSPGSRLHKAAE